MGAVKSVKLAANFYSHPRLVGLSNEAFALYLAALGYVANWGTAMFVPEASLWVLRPFAEHIAQELVDGELWLPARDGWVIDDRPTRNLPSWERRA